MNNEATGATPDSGQKPDKSSGQKIPLFKPKGHPSPLSIGDMNVLVVVLNNLLNQGVVILPAETDPDGNSVSTGRFIVSGQNIILELKIGQTGGTSGGGSDSLTMMQIVSWSTSDDFAVAKVYSFAGGASGSNLRVALPWDLRSAQNPGGSSPIIFPPYTTGNIILAADSPDGGTGVSACQFQDVNAGGRAWAQRVSYKNSACTAVHRYIVGGDEIAGA